MRYVVTLLILYDTTLPVLSCGPQGPKTDIVKLILPHSLENCYVLTYFCTVTYI